MADLYNADNKYKAKILVIGGPTASGKTALSVELAKRYGGEIISADSMQIYRGLNVGTAKVTPEEAQGIPHHMVDIAEPQVSFSVADYVARAKRCIEDISARGKLPVVAGGTGLYISSLVKGVSFTEQKASTELRERLQKQAETFGAEEMHRRLTAIDPEAAANIHPNNVARVLRALELFESTGKTMTEQKAQSLPPENPYDALCLCLSCPDRERLYRRIDRRVDGMMESGILAEAELVWKNRLSYRTAAQAIGYKEFFPFFEGESTIEDCVANLKLASRRYAKRQLTWFRRMEGVIWLDTEASDVPEQAAALAEKHLGR